MTYSIAIFALGEGPKIKGILAFFTGTCGSILLGLTKVYFPVRFVKRNFRPQPTESDILRSLMKSYEIATSANSVNSSLIRTNFSETTLESYITSHRFYN